MAARQTPPPQDGSASDDRLELFFSQSLDGFFFMMLDEPIAWNDRGDKEALLDYAFEHHRVTKANDAMLRQYGAAAPRSLDLIAFYRECGA